MDDELKRALEALEARAERSAVRVDVERVAARVLERLRTEPVAAPVRSLAKSLRVAAAVVLLAGAGATAVLLSGRGPEGAVARLVLPTTLGDSLSPEQADSLLRSIEEVRTLNVAADPSSGSVEELTEQELRALLEAMQASPGGSL
jgi:hypothetical protein